MLCWLEFRFKGIIQVVVIKGVEYVRNRIFLVLVIFLLTAAMGIAAVESTVIENKISFGKEATYKFMIKNTATTTQQYTVFSLQSGQGWNVAPVPLTDRVFSVAAGQTKTIIVSARPIRELPVGIYYLPVSVDGDLGDSYSESLKVYLGKTALETYSPSIAATINVNDHMTPGVAQSVTLFLENKNRLDLGGLTVKMSGDLDVFNHEVTIDLPSLSRKTVEFTVQPDRFAQPKEYVLKFDFIKDGKIAKTMDQKVTIETVASPFAVVASSETVWGRKLGVLSLTNNGNVRNEQQVLYPVSWFGSLLVEGGTPVVVAADGSRNMAFTLSLSPGESAEVSYVLNYRWAMYGLIFLVLLVGFIWFIQSPLRMKKRAVTTQTDEDGALAELKVTIEVENKTDKPVRHITITDTVPGIVSVEKISEMGTLRPLEIRHQGGKTKIVWLIAELDAREDRLITYKVRSKLNILGALGLPRAQAEFKQGKGMRRKAYSNSFTIR